ncbi:MULTISPECIES: TetR/AcrR family transcriptional regulator [Flagellimonas]|uniref:TetR/AcrR family transcriptional regulator n=1 Tax=Flagellimonas hadalis TaxID=2597517 RepID=A0A5N5IWV6_9FLAO|nr:TetR/AcrR family transcriptional regulator [Allomuricauda hadalis]KAB5488825.1 TetR/AcrR family transcriptional regulator [Allomuricauda hadalis]RUA14362.1 MAG: TetR/AcrR family transcriptional regulator [Flavobacteriia bacterium]
MEMTLKRRETMHRLCGKGLEIFHAKGYYNTSLDDILNELSLSKGAFYHHFKSKEDYFINIVQNLIVQKVYALLIEPLNTNENPLPVIIESLENALDPGKKNEMAYGFMLNDFLTEFNKRNEEISSQLKEIINVWEVNLVSLLKKGKLDGHIARHVDCEGVATYIIASYLGMRSLLMDSSNKQLRYQYIQQLKQYFNSIAAHHVAA